MTNQGSHTVPTLKRLAYAAPAFALALGGIPLFIYIPKFYTDAIGVDITIVGYILLSVRIFDGLTDPFIGFVSDRTSTPFGRRRPYIAVGSIMMALFVYLLFNPPQSSPDFAALWFAFTIFTLSLFWTAVNVPYESLGPEITFDYNERTTLFGIRDGFLIAGTLAAASSPTAIEWVFSLSSDPEGERTKFFWFSIMYTPIVIGLCWLCVISIREIAPAVHRTKVTHWQGLKHVAHNRAFIILLISYTISAFGSNLPATLILYYVEYVLESDLANIFLLIYFATGILFLPLWVLLAKKIGKKLAWLIAVGINTGSFLGVFFLGPGDIIPYSVLVFLSGTGFGATIAIPSSMQADVIDYDELISGQRREGQYIGIWSISKKFAAAIGVGAALSILGAAGYTPNVEQSESVQFTLRVLYALVPSICNILAFFIALTYPVNQAVHEQILTAISLRQKGESVYDPLNKGKLIV